MRVLAAAPHLVAFPAKRELGFRPRPELELPHIAKIARILAVIDVVHPREVEICLTSGSAFGDNQCSGGGRSCLNRSIVALVPSYLSRPTTVFR